MAKTNKTKGQTMIYKTLQKTKDRATRTPIICDLCIKCVLHIFI